MNEKSDYQIPKQTNYQTSLAMARERLKAMDFGLQCGRAGVTTAERGAMVPFIGREFFVDRETLEVSSPDQGPAPELWEQIIILHYLITADGKPATGDLITYKQVPDGAPYYDVFIRRTSAILLSAFGQRLPDLAIAAEKLGARKVQGHGDLAFAITALPKVEYIFVCYLPDDEFPADIKVLFDSSITGFLPAEDITVLCQMICIRLLRS